MQLRRQDTNHLISYASGVDPSYPPPRAKEAASEAETYSYTANGLLFNVWIGGVLVRRVLRGREARLITITYFVTEWRLGKLAGKVAAPGAQRSNCRAIHHPVRLEMR